MHFNVTNFKQVLFRKCQIYFRFFVGILSYGIVQFFRVTIITTVPERNAGPCWNLHNFSYGNVSCIINCIPSLLSKIEITFIIQVFMKSIIYIISTTIILLNIPSVMNIATLFELLKFNIFYYFVIVDFIGSIKSKISWIFGSTLQ